MAPPPAASSGLFCGRPTAAAAAAGSGDRSRACGPPRPSRPPRVRRSPSETSGGRRPLLSSRDGQTRGLRAIAAAHGVLAAAVARRRGASTRWPAAAQPTIRGGRGGGGAGRRSAALRAAAGAAAAPAEGEQPLAAGSLGRSLGNLVGNLALWTVVYLWFFRSVHLIDHVVTLYPRFETVVYLALAIVPLLICNSKMFVTSLEDSFLAAAKFSRPVLLKHCLRCASRPFAVSIKSMLIFFAVNLAAQALPTGFAVATPRHLTALDPDGDGVLTEAEIQMFIESCSRGLLGALLVTCLCWYFIKVKRCPKDHKPTGNFTLDVFWRRLERRNGMVVILDLVLNGLAFGATGLTWLRCIGLSPQTVLGIGGIGGIAFGFASQNVVGNVISGLLILVTRPFRTNDWIESGATKGRVKNIGWNFTSVETRPGLVVHVPNAGLLSAQTANRTDSPIRRVVVEIPVKFPEGGIQNAEKLFKEMEALMVPEVLGRQVLEEPRVFFKAFEPADYRYEPIPVLKVEVPVDNTGLGNTDDIRSRMFIPLLKYLKDHGFTVVGLEMSAQQST